MATKKKSARKKSPVRRKAAPPQKSAKRKTAKRKTAKRKVAFRRSGDMGAVHEVSVGSAGQVRKRLGIKRETIKAVEDAFAH